MKKFLVACTLIFLAGCNNNYSLIKPTSHNLSGMSVKPNVAWNQAPNSVGKNVTSWTTDGQLLNEVLFFQGIESGQALINKRQKDQELPIFRDDMLPNEIMEMFEATVSLMTNSTLISTSNLKPRMVDNTPGFEFDLDYISRNEVERRGHAVATVRDNKLFLIYYQAASLYYYDQSVENFDQIVNSINFN